MQQSPRKNKRRVIAETFDRRSTLKQTANADGVQRLMFQQETATQAFKNCKVDLTTLEISNI